MCNKKAKSVSTTVNLPTLQAGAKLHDPDIETEKNTVVVDKKTRWRGIGITVALNLALAVLGYVLSPFPLVGVMVGIVIGSVLGVCLFLKLETGKSREKRIDHWHQGGKG